MFFARLAHNSQYDPKYILNGLILLGLAMNLIIAFSKTVLAFYFIIIGK
jgi:hypothetical protein